MPDTPNSPDNAAALRWLRRQHSDLLATLTCVLSETAANTRELTREEPDVANVTLNALRLKASIDLARRQADLFFNTVRISPAEAENASVSEGRPS